MRITKLAATLSLMSILLVPSPAFAGGWVSVRYVEPPPQAIAGIPWRAQVLFKQHDLKPVSLQSVTVRATSAEHPDPVIAKSSPTGAIGVYDLELLFPAAGKWNLVAQPDQYAEVALPALGVSPADGAQPAMSVAIHLGTCDALGNAMLRLNPTAGETGSAYTAAGDWSDPLDGSALALVVESEGMAETTRMTCVEFDAGAGVVPVGGIEAGVFGALSVASVAGVTRFDLVLSTPPSAGQEVLIRIVERGSNDWVYEPARVMITPGTTVTWVNDSKMAHTVTGADPRFANSGMIDPGERFSQRFDEAGTFSYICDPHPWMTGSVEVTAP